MDVEQIEGSDQWRNQPHVWTADLAVDASRLAEYVSEGESLLCSGCSREKAHEIHRSCRNARASFMERHAEEVYGALVNKSEVRSRLSGLAYSAARKFPGLVPDEETIKTESRIPQSDKSGREIDQGIFFHHILRSATAGGHLIETMLGPTVRGRELEETFRHSGKIDLDTVTVDRIGDAAYVTLRNDECLNAEDNQLVEDLETAVDIVLLNTDVKVGVMRGGEMKHPRYRGKRVFSAGINLKLLHQGGISFLDFIIRRELGHLNKIKNGLRVHSSREENKVQTLEKPWLAAVDSFAIGGGAQTLLVFDRVVASEGSYFSVPAAHEGIIPGVANLRLARIAGGRLARQVILSGRKVSSSDPDAGLVFDEIVAASKMDECIEENVRSLDSHAVRINRKMINLMEEPADVFRMYMSEFALEQAKRLYEPAVLDKVAKKVKKWDNAI